MNGLTWKLIVLVALLLGVGIAVALLFPKQADAAIVFVLSTLGAIVSTVIGHRNGVRRATGENPQVQVVVEDPSQRVRIYTPPRGTTIHDDEDTTPDTPARRDPTRRMVSRDDDGWMSLEAVLVVAAMIVLLVTGFTFGYWAGATQVLR